MAGAPLARRLADGDWHGVDDPAAAITELAALGLEAVVEGNRCRLAHPIALLDVTAIRAALDNDRDIGIEVVDIVDSTNIRLRERAAPPPGHVDALLAECQTSGRGRTTRHWVSPFGAGIWLSIGWLLADVPRHPGTLSLAVGVAIRRALQRCGADAIELKWPNDILHGGRKLGGILIDAVAHGGGLHVVAGIGINVRLAALHTDAIARDGGLEPVDLASLAPALPARRNEIAGAVVASVVAALAEFEAKGFAPFREEWNDADGLYGHTIDIAGPADTRSGRAAGIDAAGALLVECGDSTHRYYSGDVRIRAS